MTAGRPGTAVTRERRLANLRATLARGTGAPSGPDPSPARAPFAGRRSPQLAARLAAALGADVADTPDGWLVRRVAPPLDIPVDRERLARLPGHPPPDAPLVCLDTETTGLATAAGTLAFLVGLARWEGTGFRQTQLLLPDHADEPALLAEIARWVTPDDVARHLQRQGLRLAADRGAATGSRGGPRRPTPGTWTCCRSCGACSSTGWRTRGCGPSRASCSASAGSATSRAGRSRRSTSTCCAAGRSTRSPAS